MTGAFYYRRVITPAPTEFLQLMACVNATKWKSHPAGTAMIRCFQWSGEPNNVLLTTFEHCDGRYWFDNGRMVTPFQIYAFAEFNDFDFGEPLLPEHLRN